MASQEITFPFRGVTDKTPFIKTPGDSCPPGSLRNVRVFDITKDRARGGQRPGLTRLFDTQICGGNPVQAVASFSKPPKTTGYELGTTRRVTDNIVSRTSAGLAGQAWILNPVPGMIRDFLDSRGGGAAPGICCCWHPEITNNIRRGFFCTSYTDAGSNNGKQTTGVNCIDDQGVTLWQAVLEDRQAGGSLPSTPNTRTISVNSIKVALPATDNGFVIVGVLLTRVTAPLTTQGYVYVYKASDGTYLKRYDLGGWASEAMAIAVRTDGKVAVLFNGSGAAGTLPNHPNIPPGSNAIQDGATLFRSGIMLFTATGDLAEPLRQEVFGDQLDPLDTYYEAAHGYFRFSEQLARAPFGCYPTSMAAGLDGSLLVTFSNRGWGPNGFYQPTDTQYPYTTAALISIDGIVIWEADTESIRRAYTGPWGTYYNDLPDTGDPFSGNPCTLWACAVGPAGELYVGGCRNTSSTTPSDGHNVWRLAQADGRIVWSGNVGGSASAYSAGIAQNGMAVDPLDSNVVVAGYRNAVGAVSPATSAHLWKLDAATGQPVWSYDLNTASAGIAYGVDVESRGLILYTTQKV